MAVPGAFRGGPRTGFTLIEMIVVIVVLGLAMTIVLGHGRQYSPRLSLSAARTEVIGALRAARGAAIGQDRTVEMQLSAEGRLSGNGPPVTLGDSVPVGCDERGVAPRMLSVAFLADGSARIDGAARDGEICLGASGLRTRIAIDWFTGRVHAT
jgi:general secretion pathway protein H